MDRIFPILVEVNHVLFSFRKMSPKINNSKFPRIMEESIKVVIISNLGQRQKSA